MSDGGSRSDRRHAYVPAVDEILAPPPPPVAETNTELVQRQDFGLGFVVVSANVLVTAIIVIGMLVDGQQASRAIITGSGYFAMTTVLYVFIHTGALSAIVAVWQRERTERYRIKAYLQAAQLAIGWRVRIEENRALELQGQALPADLSRRLAQLETDALERKVSAGGIQTPNAQSSFVSAYDNTSNAVFAPKGDTTAQEAIRWASCLYLDTTGLPDPAQVQTSGDQQGWLKIRMVGSKRGTGSKEAGLWLLQRRVIVRAPGGYKLNIKHYPNRESLRALLPPPRGVGGGVSAYHATGEVA